MIWQKGSLPEGAGIAPVSHIHRMAFMRPNPSTLMMPLVIRRTWLMPRVSSQMMAFIRWWPFSSTATVPDHWVVQETATMSSAGTSFLASTFFAVDMMPFHQSSGSCSAPPPGKR